MQSKLAPLYLGLFLLGTSAPALAHGAVAEYRQVRAIEVRANYDSGDPLSEAQIKIYAPDNPKEAWLTGTTQADGTFVFVPDQPGAWAAQVRKAGHGDITTIQVASSQQENAQASTWQGGNTYTPLQKGLMAAVGIWGFVGTALFFSRKKSAQKEES